MDSKEILVGPRQDNIKNVHLKEGIMVLCDSCDKPTMFVANNGKCSICRGWMCNDCVDWGCMSKTKTRNIICKECSQLFENCKGDK